MISIWGFVVRTFKNHGFGSQWWGASGAEGCQRNLSDIAGVESESHQASAVQAVALHKESWLKTIWGKQAMAAGT